ncbi:MAG: DNA mismatch repair protein MutL, partial [Eubacterium sp.]|nr:DNA mismatch repair protein MutL [Eubacterium sp.]
QHAAHEKVLYERIIREYRNHRTATQMILPAVVIEPGRADAERIRERLPVFRDLGFDIEEFGGDAFKIAGVPSNLYLTDPRELFRDITDQLHEAGSLPPDRIAERIAMMSCKAAVKGNMSLSVSEAEALFDELLTLENPYHCPHGRPTIVTVSRDELERMFKRIV